MMLTPRGPNAGPNGGPDDAPPPVTSAVIFCSPIIYSTQNENLILPKLHSRALGSLRLLLLVIDMMHLTKQLLLLLYLRLFW